MPSEPQVTVRTTEAGRVTEVVVPDPEGAFHGLVWAQIPDAVITWSWRMARWQVRIRQPGGPDVVALAGERLRIVAGRVERVSEDA